MYIQCKVREGGAQVIFDTDNVSRIDLSDEGGAAGISLKGHAGQIRITRDDYSKLKMHFKVQNLCDMPGPTKHKEP